jgi:hypothetical protein
MLVVLVPIQSFSLPARNLIRLWLHSTSKPRIIMAMKIQLRSRYHICFRSRMAVDRIDIPLRGLVSPALISF